MVPLTSIEIRYDNFAVSEDDRESLSRIFSEIAPTRLRDAFIERGGVGTTLVIILSFVGGSALSGFTWDLIKWSICGIFDGFKSHLEERRKVEPGYYQTLSLVLSFDEIDIELSIPQDSSPDFVRQLMEVASSHLSSAPLKDLPLNRIHIPMVRDGDSDLWLEGLFWSSVEFLDRYWGLAFMSSPRICGIYDSLDRQTISGEVL